MAALQARGLVLRKHAEDVFSLAESPLTLGAGGWDVVKCSIVEP